jgi:hypothetical protein
VDKNEELFFDFILCIEESKIMKLVISVSNFESMRKISNCLG